LLLLPYVAVAAPVKLSTWNLDWLISRSRAAADLPDDVQRRPDADFARLRLYANRLDADVVAFQEVDGAATAARVFDPARYTVLTIAEPVVQQVGLAVRRGIAVHQNPDVTALDVEPDARHRLRDGLDATLTLPGGQTLRVLVVHLKAGCASESHRPPCTLLAAQIPVLAAWARARAAEGVAFALMGDFNRVLDLPETMGEALANAAPLTRVTEGRSNPCWEGDDFIDHIFLGGPARAWLVAGSLRVMTYRETDPALKPHLSDHCPVSITLNPKDPPPP
jgi:endonuclease/exonuclease/phosphatase family metal-dependent hydrolase